MRIRLVGNIADCCGCPYPAVVVLVYKIKFIETSKMCTKKCDENFATQYAFVGNTKVHISEFSHYSESTPKCENGHELVLCDGDKRRSYFRHKNVSDMKSSKMSRWHCKLQGFFPKTEVEHKKKCEKQIKTRIADISIENTNTILEIQHSEIQESEVICRRNDYALHKKVIVWFIDGNTPDIELDELSDGSFLIIFGKSWKYKNFKSCYDYVLLDIGEKIFRIQVNSVCNKMIHVDSFKPMDEVIYALKTKPQYIWKLWNDNNEKKPTLRIRQEGAGNGKTYGIWRSISLNFDKETYIITTKQKSAKEVIYKELKDQEERKEDHIIENIDIHEDKKHGNQYRITYKHKKSERRCMVILGTIDSFIYSLTSKGSGGNSYFESMLNNICLNGCDKLNPYSGTIRYAGKEIKLNQRTELWIDEVQDLEILYYRAIVKIMLLTKIDCVVVGDKLQSLNYENNFLTCIEPDNTNINILRDEDKNLNRRIKVKHMAPRINKLINFDSFRVPQIETIESDLKDEGEIVIEILNLKIYSNEKNQKKVENQVSLILKKFKKEMYENNRKPEDFLLIFPILKGNVLARELETKINDLWLQFYSDRDDDNEYPYCILHRSEDGQTIDTSISKKSTRIMSIKSSKGDGRAVVFVLGCTENSLKLVSNHERNLMYESHLHVALTRAKEKIYFGLDSNGDDIHKRFANIDNSLVYKPNVPYRMTIDSMFRYINLPSCVNILKENGIEEFIQDDTTNISLNSIEWDEHCIRHCIVKVQCLHATFKYDKDVHEKSQIKVVLDKLFNLKCIKMNVYDYYDYLDEAGNDELQFMPVCAFDKGKKYIKHCEQLLTIVGNMRCKYIKNPLETGNFTSLESCVLVYLMDVFQNKKHHDMTPNKMYQLLDAFERKNYIQKFLEYSENAKTIMSDLVQTISSNGTIRWNTEHVVKFDSSINDLRIWNRYNVIGHDDNTVHHIVFNTNFSKMNYWETNVKILVERMLLKNSNKNDREQNNNTRFSNKKIITYLIILNQNKYEKIEWDFDDRINNDMKQECRNACVRLLKTHNIPLFNFCKFIKKDPSKWLGFQTPYQFLANEFKPWSHIFNFFTQLHQMSNGSHDLVKKITDNIEDFTESLNKHIYELCDTYFYLNEQVCDIEW